MRPARSRSGTIASSLGRALRFRPLWIISSLASETVSVESCRRQMTSRSRDGVPATADQGPRWDVRTWARAETARRRGRGSREMRRGPRGASGGLQRNASVWQESKRCQGSTLQEQVASQADLEADHQHAPGLSPVNNIHPSPTVACGAVTHTPRHPTLASRPAHAAPLLRSHELLRVELPECAPSSCAWLAHPLTRSCTVNPLENLAFTTSGALIELVDSAPLPPVLVYTAPS